MKPSFALFRFTFLLPVACLNVINASVLDHHLLDDRAYPVALAAIKDGKLIEISSAHSEALTAQDDAGNRIDINDTRMELAKGSGFAQGQIRVVSSEAIVLKEDEDVVSIASRFAARKPQGIQVEANLTPSRDFSNVVMATVFFTEGGLYELVAQSIGDLQGGRTHAISLKSPTVYDYVNHTINYTFLFFSEEGEIVSDVRRRATPLVNRMFEDFYGKLITGFQMANGVSDRSVSLVHRYPIDFAGLDRLVSKKSGKTIFTLSIDETGLVQSVEAEEKLNSKLLERCQRSLKEWLFLPRLQDGFAVASKARIPVYWD